MTARRIFNIIVLLLCLVGAIYYTLVNKEAQGAVVLLLGILYFVALPHL